jgi:hypothetical protein
LRKLDQMPAAWLYGRPPAPCKDAAVPIRHLFAIALALIAWCAAQAPAVMAQTAPGPATQPPAAPDPAVTHAMVFYDAHGEANACGPGCSEWIAAEGKIDGGTADRLQRLLAQLKGARPPIFFHSPGGSVTGSMSLGEIIRARKLTASVGHTVPLNCDPYAKNQNSCDAEIRAGHPIEAKLDLLTAMCNSGCVYALAGGVVRLIPPWVTLGIHDVGLDPATAKVRHPSTLAIETAKAVTHTRLRNFIRRMGIDEGLLTEAFATPFSSVGRLSRDDAARFGLDRRELGETVWQFVDKPRPAIRKLFFVRADNGAHRYVNALVTVSCAPWLGGRAIAVLARQRLDSDTETVVGQPAVSIRVNGQDVRLARAMSAKLYLWSGQFAVTTLDAVSDEAAMVLPGAEFGRQPGPSGDVSLAMTGFSAAYAKLKVCGQETAQAHSTWAATRMPPLANLQSATGANAMPPLRSNPLAIGASRLAVDATLGVPTKTVGTTALYGYSSSDSEHKIIAAYFDGSGRLQRLARYVLKDGKVLDEISQTELSEGQELIPVRDLLAAPKIRAGSGRPAAPPGWSKDQAGTASSLTLTPPSSRRQE